MSTERTEFPLPPELLPTVVGFLSPRDKASFGAVCKTSRAATALEHLDKFSLERMFHEKDRSLSRSKLAKKAEVYLEGLSHARWLADRNCWISYSQPLSDEAFLKEVFFKLCKHPSVNPLFLDMICELYPSIHCLEPTGSEESLDFNLLYAEEMEIFSQLYDFINSGKGPKLIETLLQRYQAMVKLAQFTRQKLQNTYDKLGHHLTECTRKRDDIIKRERETAEFVRTRGYGLQVSARGTSKSLEPLLADFSTTYESMMMSPLNAEHERLNEAFAELTSNQKILKRQVTWTTDRMTKLASYAANPTILFQRAIEMAIYSNNTWALEGIRSFLKEQESLPGEARFMRKEQDLFLLFQRTSMTTLLKIAAQEIEQIPALLSAAFNEVGSTSTMDDDIIKRAGLLIELYQKTKSIPQDIMHQLFLRCLSRRDQIHLFTQCKPLFNLSRYSFSADEIHELCTRLNVVDLHEFQKILWFTFPANALKRYLASASIAQINSSEAWRYLLGQQGINIEGLIDWPLILKYYPGPERRYSCVHHSLHAICMAGATVADERCVDHLLHVGAINEDLAAMHRFCIRRRDIESDHRLSDEERKKALIELHDTFIHREPVEPTTQTLFKFMKKTRIPFPEKLFEYDDDYWDTLKIEINELKALLATGEYPIGQFSSVARLLVQNYPRLSFDDLRPALNLKAIQVDFSSLMRLIKMNNSDVLKQLALEPLRFPPSSELLYLVFSEDVPLALVAKVIDTLDASVNPLDFKKIIKFLAAKPTGGEQFYQLWLKLLSIQMMGGYDFGRFECFDEFIQTALEHKASPSMTSALLKLRAPLPSQEVLFRMLGCPNGPNFIGEVSAVMLLNAADINNVDMRQKLVCWMIRHQFSAPQIWLFAKSREDWSPECAAVVLLSYRGYDLNLDLILSHLYQQSVPSTGDPLQLLSMALEHKVSPEIVREFFQFHDPLGRNRWGMPIRINSMTYQIARRVYGDSPEGLEAIIQALDTLKEEGRAEQTRLQGFFQLRPSERYSEASVLHEVRETGPS